MANGLLAPVICVLCACGADPVEIDGTRFTPETLPVESAAMAAADFNGDGHRDLVAAGEPLVIFLGDGGGRLRAAHRVAGGEHPVDFAIADIDEDGDVDIVVANHDTDYVTLLLGDGSGVFAAAPNSPMTIAVSPHPHAVRLVDFDADGRLDLAVDHRDGAGVLILRGLGGGRFESPGTLVAGGGDPYRDFAVGDVNGDGRPDLVTPNPSEVAILLNAGGGALRFEPAPALAGVAAFAVELADLDGDGDLDLAAAADEESPLVHVFHGDGAGAFTEAAGSPLRVGFGAKKIAAGDFNGDGVHDIAVTAWRSSDVLVALGGPGPMRTARLPAGEHPWGLAAADFNADGADDLVIGDGGDPRAVLYLSGDR